MLNFNKTNNLLLRIKTKYIYIDLYNSNFRNLTKEFFKDKNINYKPVHYCK